MAVNKNTSEIVMLREQLKIAEISVAGPGKTFHYIPAPGSSGITGITKHAIAMLDALREFHQAEENTKRVQVILE